MKRILFILLAFTWSTCSYADEAAEQESSKKPDSPYGAAVFRVIESTQASLDEFYDPIESEMAEVVRDESKKLLANPSVFKGLIHDATVRLEADKADADESFDENHMTYAKLAMAGLQTTLRQTPGVMTPKQLSNRALLIAEVAKYYSTKDPSMCRFLPQDFSILLNVDAPWVETVSQSILEDALKDESQAALKIYEGLHPIIISDVDVQIIFSKFAGEWLQGLAPEVKNEIAMARNAGNYCPLWATMLKDGARMAATFPRASNKVLLPLMSMPSRGWLDVGRWAVTIETSVDE